MHIALPHKTTKEKAVNKIKDGLAQGRSQIAEHATIKEEKWEGDTLHFSIELQNKTISGTLEVTDTEYVLDATLPLLWRMFEGRIEREIAERVKSLS